MSKGQVLHFFPIATLSIIQLDRDILVISSPLFKGRVISGKGFRNGPFQSENTPG